MIQADSSHRLHEYLCGLARDEFGKAVKVGGTEDHIHGLISLRTDVALAHAMNRWKSLSSGWIHKTFPDMGDFAWQAGYGAFSVSQSSAPAVISYIEGQASHHRRKTFEGTPRPAQSSGRGYNQSPKGLKKKHQDLSSHSHPRCNAVA
jgi:REP element-mobilizing transposase RayT